MSTVRVDITNSDKFVGAMVKALAVEVAGFQAVAGTTNEFLGNHGYYKFHFSNDYQAKDFRETVSKYINNNLAVVVD